MKNIDTDQKESCFKQAQSSKTPCTEINCRHFLESEQDLNCSIIAANHGPKTLQEIGNYYGISRMRVCQIEKSILKKLRKDSKFLAPYDPSSS